MSETDGLVKQAGELADADKLDEALELTNRVLFLEPDNHKALFVAGSVLLKAGRHVQAMQLLKRVIDLKPNDHRGWGQVALCYGEIHRYDESIRHAEKALSIRREAKTLSDAAYAHINAGNWEVGEKLAQDAYKLDPEFETDARIHLVNCALAKGDWETGFKGYKLTERTKFRKEWHYGDTKEWFGDPGAVLMVTGEQGLGDEIMAASVIPSVHCRQFIFDCDERLQALFQRSFPDAIVTGTRRSQTVTLPVMPTHHKSLFGLCEVVRRRDADFPRTPYLIPNPDYVAMFKAMFAGKRVIGLAWSGGLPRTGQEQRKAGLTAFAPLIRRGGAEFVSLEYKDDEAEVRQFEATHGMRVRRLPWVAQGQDMDLLAGLIAACDEVVGVATASLHMASALGVPTTFIANRGLNWVFQPPELLWYPPTTKLWRKKSGESWRDCVNRLVESRK